LTGGEVQEHRKALGLSQIALAQRAGVSRNAVKNWGRVHAVGRWAAALRSSTGLFAAQYAKAAAGCRCTGQPLAALQ